MHSSRFPCRVCGQSTDGPDTYVICQDCADEYERQAEWPATGRPDFSADDVRPLVPLSDDEVEARLRHLLDSW